MIEFSKYMLRLVIIGAIIGVFVVTISGVFLNSIDFESLTTSNNNIIAFFGMMLTYVNFIFKVVMIPKGALTLFVASYSIIIGANLLLLGYAFIKTVIYFVTNTNN